MQSRLTFALASAAFFAACLPSDTRPPPGHLSITVTAVPPTLSAPVSTDDGWTVAIDRYLVSVKLVALGDTCSVYYQPSYGRVISLLVPGPQKLNQLFGLGTCDFSFSLSAPGVNDLVGAGVADDDVRSMRTPGADPYVPIAGVSAEVRGRAIKGDASKTFHWVFRGGVDHGSCTLPGADPKSAVALAANVDAAFDLLARGDALLRDGLEDGARLRFAAIAAADTSHGDGNGDITLEELARSPIEEARGGGGYSTDGSQARGLELPSKGVESLLDFVYFVQIQRLLRFRDGGGCATAFVRAPKDD